MCSSAAKLSRRRAAWTSGAPGRWTQALAADDGVRHENRAGVDGPAGRSRRDQVRGGEHFQPPGAQQQISRRATALIKPLNVTLDGVFIDLGVMLALNLAVVPLLATRYRIGRLEGAALLIAYLAYVGFLYR